MNLTGSSWKTTLAGIISGLGVGVDALITAFQQGAFNGKTGAQLAVAIGLVLLGVFSKDVNVTGGTVVNTENNAAVVTESSKVTVPPEVPQPVITEK